jgi:hypothetical protein
METFGQKLSGDLLTALAGGGVFLLMLIAGYFICEWLKI